MLRLGPPYTASTLGGLLMVLATACGDDSTTLDAGLDGDVRDDGGDAERDGGPAAITSCTDLAVSDIYPDATDTGECTTEAGLRIARSMMNLEGISIDNNGTEMVPCLRVECDDEYAYIVSNNIAHYDFVVLTPNPLTESLSVHRIPLAPTAASGTDAADIATLDGCDTTYDTYIAGGPTPAVEPSGYCGDGHLSESRAAGTRTYAQLGCLSQFGIMNSGVVANGPNEGDRGVWGDPGLEPVNALAEGPCASVDYCGGHTGMSMHYHSAFEECFAIDEARAPTLSYALAGTHWDQLAQIEDDCTEPSGIVAWSLDGHPIKGPCVCIERSADGACTTVKRARSAWLYRGLTAHADDPADPDASLSVEGQECASNNDCCAETPCDFACNYAVTDGENAGTDVARICTLKRYAWCSREYVDLESQDVSSQNFVYLDVCNGHEGVDGFAYHTTATFPYIQGCYRGEPAAQAATMGGGGPPPRM